MSAYFFQGKKAALMSMLVLLVQKNKQDFCLFTISVYSAQARLSTQWGHSIYEVAFESLYRGSSLSTIFGILKKTYYAKIVLVSTTQPISTSTNFTTQQSVRNSTSTNFIPMAPKFVLVEIVLVETVLVGDPQ